MKMRRFLAFADLHLHNWREFSTRLENGRNSRLQDGIDVLDQICTYAIHTDIELVVFLGDLIHMRVRNEVEVYNAAYSALKKFGDAGIELLAVVGNHDQALKSNLKIHALKPFSEIITVVDEPTVIRRGDVQFMIYPYGYELGTLTQDKDESIEHRFLLGHMGIQGAVVGSGLYSPKEEIVLDQVHQEGADLALLGHYHKHQWLSDKCIYAGSPLQLNWNDTGDIKGFLDIWWDHEGVAVDHVPTRSPKFVETDLDGILGEDQQEKLSKNFLRLRLQPGQKLVDVRDQLDTIGVRSFYVIEESLAEEKKRVDIDLDLSFSDMVPKYVAYQETILDKARLEDIGLELVDDATV